MADLDAPEFAQGWVNDPQEVEVIVAQQPYKTFSDTEAGKFMPAADLPKNVYLWDAARKVLGKLLPPRSQGKVGSCVANEWCRPDPRQQRCSISISSAEEGYNSADGALLRVAYDPYAPSSFLRAHRYFPSGQARPRVGRCNSCNTCCKIA